MEQQDDESGAHVLCNIRYMLIAVSLVRDTHQLAGQSHEMNHQGKQLLPSRLQVAMQCL